jgi:flagellar biosynthetic protein FliQ
VTTEAALDLMRNAMLVAATVATPVLMAALIVGLAVGVLQTATQVNEASLSFLFKLAAVALALVVFGPTMLDQLVEYTRRSIASIGQVVP